MNAPIASYSPARVPSAFPKQQQVILKLGEPPPKSLEGRMRDGLLELSKDLPIPKDNSDEPRNNEVIISSTIDTNNSVDVNTQNNVDPPSHLTPSISGYLPERFAHDLLNDNPPSLTDVISMGDPTVDIHATIAGRYGEDDFFKRILQDPGTFKNFEVSND
ncbi:hypothetical protein AZE42_10317 [Rhizopogon vesiculosus]|uniref:Uncharacterized protein n=1 Tax=Rhizopogon vesiculosus TaxID=180088 RepID=A0A1J8QUV2_9AGAM|nr:hypothetical protein AZE42_10317 [Rhizopogon vesiculosus]